MRKLPLLLVVLLAACSRSPESATPAEASLSASRIAGHVRFLSDDLLEGRGTATRGGDLVTLYIATQLRLLGLEPAGDNGTYYQRVPLVGVETLPTSALSWDSHALHFLSEYVGVDQRQQSEAVIDAPAVFVGHGIVAPEFQWDDYKNTDVKGKFVILFTNEPPSTDPKFFGGPALTYYGRWTYKFEEAARQGALGCLIIHTDKTAGYGWQVVRNSWSGRQPYVKLNAGQPALAFAGWVTEQIGDQIFKTIGKSAAEMLAAADTRGFQPLPLPIHIRGRIESSVSAMDTRSVVARLSGADPQRKDEAVLYTAHWDHLGIGPAVNGDSIYNGAVDNATGCGILLETARAFTQLNPRPARSILFAAVGAEEGGLLGSQYLGEHPPVPAGKIAADLNYDGIFPFGRTTDITLPGYERTTLRSLVEQTAQAFHLKIEPDPHPEQGHYYRSDHFSLARVGVPAFSLDLGTQFVGKPSGWGEKAYEEYNDKHYHQPSDEFDPSWDFSGLAELARFGFRLGLQVANQPQLPTWQPGDEFLPARDQSWGRRPAR
ncbi:MAG TPA: M28 family peptidase [Bryobacterales bacterium]|nr:M28 family peptidase [Bryobacterales bacterium]